MQPGKDQGQYGNVPVFRVPPAGVRALVNGQPNCSNPHVSLAVRAQHLPSMPCHETIVLPAGQAPLRQAQLGEDRGQDRPPALPRDVPEGLAGHEGDC